MAWRQAATLEPNWAGEGWQRRACSGRAVGRRQAQLGKLGRKDLSWRGWAAELGPGDPGDPGNPARSPAAENRLGGAGVPKIRRAGSWSHGFGCWQGECQGPVQLFHCMSKCRWLAVDENLSVDADASRQTRPVDVCQMQGPLCIPIGRMARTWRRDEPVGRCSSKFKPMIQLMIQTHGSN